MEVEELYDDMSVIKSDVLELLNNYKSNLNTGGD
jgi:hypothetical protein